jgi:hypothetical protein
MAEASVWSGMSITSAQATPANAATKRLTPAKTKPRLQFRLPFIAILLRPVGRYFRIGT